MSIDEETSNEGEGIENLRKQYKSLKAEREQLAEELASFRAERRTKTVAETLKAKGLDEARAAKAASLYSGDDASEDAVGKWLESYADVFNIQTSNGEQNAAVERVSGASFGSADTIQNGPRDRVLGAPDEIARAIQTLPYEELVKLGYMPKPGVAGAPRR